ncbi:MAG: GNAT family N-acetyltransferase [Lewinella sp.]|nr:GNAT family N-acetyltransferase [Lewinella sp.]
MLPLIDHNFRRHATRIPSRAAGMTVEETPHLSYVDSRLDCDTFNIIHLHDGTEQAVPELARAVAHFRDRSLAYCLWLNEGSLTPAIARQLAELGMTRQGEEVGMVLELAEYTPATTAIDPHIQVVQSPAEVADYAEVVARNWSPPDEQVRRYYHQTASLYLDSDIRLLVYYLDGRPVGTVELFPTDAEVLGLYGLATLHTHRRRGIGSALMRVALQLARDQGYRQVVLQASEDGLGIYQQMGFRAAGMFFEYA